jgi:1-aminocyclopropane-1-carboxylate deaminase/D-cysteine desulfhydrase-like pyridoxal-dependent ACC family enzyme
MNLPSPLQELNSELFTKKNIRVYIKRDDLIDPVVSGNKWRKLKYNIEKFKSEKYDKLLTFGGAFSNHIAATARVGKELAVPTIGIIRGEELNIDSNHTIRQAAKDGMQLVFTKREEYTLREEKYYHEELRRRHGHLLIVPEGGSNYQGLIGCQEICKEIEVDFDYIITACGTATTATGLLLGSNAEVIGVSALKGGDFLKENVKKYLQEFGLIEQDSVELYNRFQLKTDYHFGGYAKYNEILQIFIQEFEEQHDIPLEQVYTGKMMFGLMDLIKHEYFPKDSNIVALHTGGLQGKIEF